MHQQIICCCLALFLSTLPNAISQTTLPLSDLAWTVSSPTLNISVLGEYPSQAHLDLFNAGVVGDPYHGNNEINLRFVAQSNWTYSALLNGLDRDAHATWLLFKGLDTFTSIEFCGEHVASTNNQFRQYAFDVTKILSSCSPGNPPLSINFGSARDIVDDIANEPGQETWPAGVQQVFEFPNRHFMRKEQSDFGWDWGPAFAPAGPWLPGYVVQLGDAEIYETNTLVDVYRTGQRNNRIPDQNVPWVLNCSMDYLGALPAHAALRYQLKDGRGRKVAGGGLGSVTIQDGTVTGSTKIDNSLVELWWPNGLGQQTLYHLTLDVVDRNKTLASVQRTIGFRTIVLNSEVVSKEEIASGIAPGNNWHFEVNGHPFFAKGSNIIPPDAFWPRVDKQKIRRLFEAVIAANQNMLRVWSSGAYSPDFMYEIADELGILLWSEFEFGDSLYPVDQAFLDNVYEEAVYQVRRVNHHPSLAFWAGGNELENLELLLVNGTGKKDYVRYKNEYEKLFLSTLFPAVFENTRSISYAPSSTSNGYISLNFTDAPYMQERYENLEKGSIYGETDYYNYNSRVAFNISSYPVGRFSNEFGYHSMPSLQSWQQVLAPRDLHFNSSVILSRNHHYPPGTPYPEDFTRSLLGQAEMSNAARLWFPFPMSLSSTRTSTDLFQTQIHATQLFQAAYYVSQIAFYRRGSGLPQRTLGSLYWQLNDIWQAPSWAGIEYDGRWKVLHYRGQDIYKNVIVYPFFNEVTDGNVSVWVMSDLWGAVTGRVDVTWYTWDGNISHRSASGQEFSVGALNASRVWQGDVKSIVKSVSGTSSSPTQNLTSADLLIHVNITAHGHRPNTSLNSSLETFTHETWMAASSLAQANLVDPGLCLTYDHARDVFVVEAKTGVAAWVWLDYPAGAVVEVEENGFWLGRGGRKEVEYLVRSDGTGGKWRDGVEVRSVWDNTLF